jgi:branched-chain amino acid transport system substrate-binding protein
VGTTRQRVRAASIATLVSAAASIIACSLLVSPEDCHTDDDCLRKGGAFAKSVCSAGLCVVEAGACTANAECGPSAICNKTSRTCARLLSQDCVKVVGDPSSDDAVILGVMAELTTAPLGNGPALAAAMELAEDEIAENAHGLPGAGATRRALVLVECSQSEDPLRAARYLVETIGVPAILGPSASGTAIAVATTVTLPAKALLMAPTATSPSLTALENDGLVWRTSPSDVLQAKALAGVVGDLEGVIVKATPSTKGQVRVALVVKGDSYGKGVRDLMLPDLSWNGQRALDQPARFLSREYANTDVTPVFDFSPIVAELVTFQPNIVILVGTSEALTIMRGVDAALGTTSAPPLYLLGDGLVSPDTLAVVADDDALRARIIATRPGSFTTPTFLSFRGRLEAKYGVGAFDPKICAVAADATYLVAYAAVATANEPLSGLSLARGLRMVTAPEGMSLPLEPNSINQAFALLHDGKKLKVIGASSPLDYVPGTGDPIVDIDVDIVCRGATGQAVFWSSGRYFDSTRGALAGAFTTCP